jgi:hypothetical protein
MAILRQRNNKAPGIDGIPVELFKANEVIKKEINCEGLENRTDTSGLETQHPMPSLQE